MHENAAGAGAGPGNLRVRTVAAAVLDHRGSWRHAVDAVENSSRGSPAIAVLAHPGQPAQRVEVGGRVFRDGTLRVAGIPLDSVAVDSVKGAQDCVRHLLRMGHRDIAIITGSLDLPSARERLKGYEEAFREAGIAVPRELVFKGDFREASGYRLGEEILLAREIPTALFVSNGLMCLGVLQALDEIGVRCPRDIALATFDDLPFGRAFHPHLTSVAQPTYELGFHGANLLIDRIEGRLGRSLAAGSSHRPNRAAASYAPFRPESLLQKPQAF